jgi:hypothetical protein
VECKPTWQSQRIQIHCLNSQCLTLCMHVWIMSYLVENKKTRWSIWWTWKNYDSWYSVQNSKRSSRKYKTGVFSLEPVCLVIRSTVFCYMTVCRPMEVSWCSEGAYHLHLQGWRISHARNQHAAGTKQCLHKVGWFSTDYTA